MFSEISLKKRRLEKDLSQVEIAEMLNINKSSYSSWESGRAKPNKKNLAALAKILDVDVTYFESEYNIVNNFLQLTTANKQKSEEYVEELMQSQQSNKVIQLFPVPVLSEVALSAGLGEALFDEYETETVYSDEEQLGYDIAAWINGKSMEPIYQDGEVALIRSSGFDYDGAVYALSWNDSVFIKKLYREKEGFRMLSLNDKYPDEFIPYEDDPHIVGKVVGHFMPVIGS